MGIGTWHCRLMAALLFAGISINLGPVAAQSSSGTMATTAFAQPPEGEVVEIQFFADTEINQAVREVIVRELAARGYRVAPSATLVMRFETTIETDNRGSPPVQIGGTGGNEERRSFDLRINPLAERPPAVPGASRYSLTMSLARAGGGQYWMAQATVDAGGRDRRAVARAMALALMDQFGFTVKEQPLVVD